MTSKTNGMTMLVGRGGKPNNVLKFRRLFHKYWLGCIIYAGIASVHSNAAKLA